ncbi:hypothetical protein ACO22_00226 [Paracoccidioides brasiliensis]|uniref:Uncharacterized protein n=1 Tax=Paracoccidioides brasiliensis TaxID=121759 RepID=A0A1D2JPV4_PARBR|nr:hypothetical protein ACO22_00226 [Paracoccidioides brasiliensis]
MDIRKRAPKLPLQQFIVLAICRFAEPGIISQTLLFYFLCDQKKYTAEMES